MARHFEEDFKFVSRELPSVYTPVNEVFCYSVAMGKTRDCNPFCTLISYVATFPPVACVYIYGEMIGRALVLVESHGPSQSLWHRGAYLFHTYVRRA
jgi:hypothetical protein